MRLFISTIFYSFLFIHLSLYPLFGQNDPVKPNFVLIVADDLGYADLGFQGSKQIPTPSIDRLAESGIIFTNGYVSSPVCSPSRAGLITGKNQVSFGFDNNLFPAQPGFDPNYVGLPLTDLVLSLDICPTFIEAAGGKISEKDNYRGVNIIPFLIVQETDYPWKEKVTFTIQPDSPHRFKLALRIPGWARTNGCFPSDIYRFDDNKETEWKVSVNSKIIDVKSLNKGYVQISRKWKTGDKVELSLPMPTRQVYSHPNIETTRGKVALMRGPVLYCLEAPDNNFNVLGAALAPDPEIEHEYKQDFLGGVTVLNGIAINSGNEPVQFTAIPYYAWQNRGIHEMTVWMYQDINQINDDKTQNIKDQQNPNETIKELTR
ncbi:hypothetical protein ES705_16274 [subsurface metagenome]